MSANPEDAVLLLRSLKAAGERTGAVEAEGALHLRRTSRRTMDGIHDAAALVLPGAAGALPAPKFPTSSPGAAPAAASTGAAPGAAAGGGTSGPAAPAAISATGSSPAAGGTAPVQPPSSPLNTVVSAVLPASNSLPLIASTATSPAASPSRLAARVPAPLSSLTTPGAAASSNPAGAAGAGSPGASGALASPSSPPHPVPVSFSVSRRTSQSHSPSYLAHELSQLPHSHGSPLPLLFDSPFMSSSPTGMALAGQAPTGAAPPSPSLRQGAPSPLPSISGAPPALSSPTPPPPMPSMLTASSPARVSSGRASNGAGLLAAAAAGGGAKPLPPAPSSPSGAPATPSAATSPSSGGLNRPLRVSAVSGSGLSLPAAAGASYGNFIAGSPTRGDGCVSLDLPRQLLQRPASARSGQGPGGSATSSGGVAPTMGGGGPTTPDAFNASASLRRLSMTGGLELTLGGSQKLVMAAAHELSAIAQHAHTQGGHGSQSSSGGAPQQLPSPVQLQQLSNLLPPPPGAHRLGVKSARAPSSTVSGGAGGGGGPPSLAPFGKVPGRDARLSDPGMPGSSSADAATTASGGGGGGGSTAALNAPESPPVGRPSLAPLPSAAVQAAKAATPPAATAVGLGPYVPTSQPLHHRSAARPEPLPTSARRASMGGTPSAAAAAAALAMSSPEQSPTAVRASTPMARSGALAPMPPAAAASASIAAAASSAVRSGPGPVAESWLGSEQDPDPAALLGPSGGFSCVLMHLNFAPIARASVPMVGRPRTLAPMPPGAASGLALRFAPGPVAESSLGSTPDLDPAAMFGSGGGFRSTNMELTVRSIAVQPSAAAGGGGGAAAAPATQSSVRQKLQADPLRFHPPTAAVGCGTGGRRLTSGSNSSTGSDVLDATPRLVLGTPSQARAALPHLDHLGTGSGGNSSSPGRLPAVTAAGGGDLWVPSQDILPHMVGRTNSAGGGSSRWSPAGGGSGSGVSFSPLRGPATPASAGSGASLDPPTPRFRTLSANGINCGGSASSSASSGSAAAATAVATPATAAPAHQVPQQRGTGPQPAVSSHPPQSGGGRQSSYLQSLAAAAGLDAPNGAGGGGGSAAVTTATGAGGDDPSRRLRSLSDSGFAAFMAAGDCRPVGLCLDGGLSVLGSDMWSRLQAERNHNTRYSGTVRAEDGTAADLSGTLDDAELQAVHQAAKQDAKLPLTSKLPPSRHDSSASSDSNVDLGLTLAPPPKQRASDGADATASAPPVAGAAVQPRTPPKNLTPLVTGVAAGSPAAALIGASAPPLSQAVPNKPASKPPSPGKLPSPGHNQSLTSPGSHGTAGAAGQAVVPNNHGNHHVNIRLDASVSSLPLKALKHPPAAAR